MAATRVVLTIDVESDAWLPARGPRTYENLAALPGFVRRLMDHGLRPTLLPTWSVFNHPPAAEMLRALEATGQVEVGAHLHPWSTPPATETVTTLNSMMCNLDPQLQLSKLTSLTAAARAAGFAPKVFRAGRWGFGPSTAQALVAEGSMGVDCSVMPYVSWADDFGPDFHGAPLHPYRFEPGAPVTKPQAGGALIEVPVTVGFTRRPFGRWADLRRRFAQPGLSPLRIIGLAARTGLVQRVILSPEVASVADLSTVSRLALAEGAPLLHMALHSQSLWPGGSPFAPDAEGAERVAARVLGWVSSLSSVEGMTVSEAAALAG